MSADDRDLAVAEARARDALRGLTATSADPAFRARLLRSFTTGDFGSAPRRIGLAAPPWYRRWALAWAVPVGAAAAFALVSTLNRGPEWQLVSSSGSGVAVVDGLPVPMNHTDDLARRVRGGARIQVPDDGTMVIMSANQLAVQFTPGTDATVPDRPRRWFGRRSRAEVRNGEIRVTSGAAFHGARLAITTPAAAVEVTGTTLAVICEPTGTCVCVHEGRVRVGDKIGPMVEVPAGHRRYVFNDGRPAEEAGIRDTEPSPLSELKKRMAAGAAGAP